MVNYADARVMRWCHVRQLVHHPAGVEGTGSYGAELTRALTAGAVEVIDVDRPDRASRRAKGKSDPLDAYAAARVVASGRASAVPKSRDGIAESIRCLRVARRSAVKAKTQCINQIRQLDRDLVELTTAAPPGLMAKFGVRVDVTAHLLVIAGDNPQRHRARRPP